MKLVEFEAIPNWPGGYIHRCLSDFLVVYVDDFRWVAPNKNIQALWNLIGKKLSLEPPTPFGRSLVCETRSFEAIFHPSRIPGFHNSSAVRGPVGDEQSSAPRGHYHGI